MGKKCVLLCLLLTLLGAAGSRAEIVSDLHSASVPVDSQSSQALAAASRQALAEVLVKVSGSRQVLSNPQIAAALAKARSHVQQYAYVRGEAPGPKLSVLIEFDGGYVTDLVTRAGVPLWTANRPLVLAWVVINGEQGRQFINWDTTPNQAQLLAAEFSRRGVPVQLPVFDLVDLAAASPDAVWGLDPNVIQSASARYNVQDIVAGRLANLSDGELAGDWRYFYQNQQMNRSVTVSDLQSFLRDIVNSVAGEMAARYAVAPTAGEDGGIRMSVTGVSTYADYAAIVSWMEGLELVEYAHLESVQGDRIELRVQAKAAAPQLATLIELNAGLLPMQGSATGAQLNYQWRK